jgi:hypothetical protein
MSSFAPLKQIDAGVLNIRYAEAGPADGTKIQNIGAVIIKMRYSERSDECMEC